MPTRDSHCLDKIISIMTGYILVMYWLCTGFMLVICCTLLHIYFSCIEPRDDIPPHGAIFLSVEGVFGTGELHAIAVFLLVGEALDVGRRLREASTRG